MSKKATSRQTMNASNATLDLFEPDGIEFDDEGMLDLITGTFKDHTDGIPEWVKNSSDMYRREGINAEDSHILVLSRNRRKGKRYSAIGCLDFGGMSVDDIESKFRRWGDPEASGRNHHAGVTGGHGNGGKAYMLSMFDEKAYIHTLCDGKASRYGFPPNSKELGYFSPPERQTGKGYSVADPEKELNQALSLFNLTLADLPSDVKKLWERRQSFTLVVGFEPKDCSSQLPNKQWINKLRWHPQMIHVMRMNQIRWYHSTYNDSELVDGADPLRPEPIPPHPVETEPRRIDVPEVLVDPQDGREITTRSSGDTAYLQLRTSEPNMTSSKWESRHKVYGWAEEGRSTGYWDVDKLSTAAYAKHIYGDVLLPQLKEFEQNARREHANAPLIRALKHWMGERIGEYAREFSEYERSQATQEQKNELSQMNSALNRWTNSFLSKELDGIDGGRGVGGKDDPPGLPKRPVKKIELALTHAKAGRGVTLTPRKKFFGASGQRVQSISNTLKSSNSKVASVEGDGTIKTHQPGTTDLWVSCAASNLESDKITLEVLHIDSIEVIPEELEVEQASRSPLEASVITTNGIRHEGVYLSWMEGNQEIASVGSSGMVHGRQPGKTTVTAYDHHEMGKPARVTVTHSTENADSDGGNGSPKILLSEVDDDPFGEGPPEFTPEEPPIHQRPVDVDRNVWWVNMASPLARRYVERSSGNVRQSTEWRLYLVERYIEAVSKIVVSHEIGNDQTSFNKVSRGLDEQASEMQHRIAESLSDFLDSGILPGESNE